MLGFAPLASIPLGDTGSQGAASPIPPIGPFTPIQLAALADEDKYVPTWQLLMGVPKRVLLAGQNTVAISPPPNDAYGVVLDVVSNAPVPTVGTDVLQVSQDIYESILDIAQHIALVKEGPGQLEAAQALLERAATAAGINLRIQQASQPSREPMLSQTLVDERSSARELDVAVVE